MQKGLLGPSILAATITVVSQSAVAQNDPWCLVNQQKGTTSCAFVSRAQCLQSTGGNVGYCVANPFPPAPARGSRRPDG